MYSARFDASFVKNTVKGLLCPLQEYRGHIRDAHGRSSEKNLELPCRVCGKVFEKKMHLRKHLRTHKGASPNTAPGGGLGSGMTAMKNCFVVIYPGRGMMTGKKFLWSITVPSGRCALGVEDKTRLHSITRLSTPTKVNCELCSPVSSSCVKRFDVMCHCLSESRQPSNTCNVCGKSYVKRTNLMDHIRKVHEGTRQSIAAAIRFAKRKFTD